MNKKEIWQAVLGDVEITISKATFVTWFNNTFILEINNKQAVVAVPNGFSKEWLENKYSLFVKKSLAKHYGEIEKLEFRITQPQKPILKNNHSAEPLPNAFSENHLNSEDSQETAGQNFHPTQTTETGLNSRYTFNNLIAGNHNELAFSACKKVALFPGTKYNPLFIHGGVGLGKTHLLQAIGNSANKNGGLIVKYVTSERFTTELVGAIKKQQIDSFKEAYRRIDILLIDDIQFIGGKEKTQEEFFHVFNALYQNNKQIVLCSDRPPKSIATLEERLRSRFEGGIIVDVLKPDLETRMAILTRKAQEIYPEEIPQETLLFIAQSIKTNVRELEGVLNRLLAVCELQQSFPSLENAEKFLGKIIQTSEPIKQTPEKIIQAVGEFFGIKKEEIKGKKRGREIMKPRQVSIYLIRRQLGLSYPAIGKEFGGKNHTTIMHSYNKISKTIEQDPLLKQEVSSILARIC
jgi:chromosomal replication initiator protein